MYTLAHRLGLNDLKELAKPSMLVKIDLALPGNKREALALEESLELVGNDLLHAFSRSADLWCLSSINYV